MMSFDRGLSQKLERTEARGSAAFVESRAALAPESGVKWVEVEVAGAAGPTAGTTGSCACSPTGATDD